MAMIKGDAAATKAYRERKSKALAKNAAARKAETRAKAQTNRADAK